MFNAALLCDAEILELARKQTLKLIMRESKRFDIEEYSKAWGEAPSLLTLRVDFVVMALGLNP